MRAPRAWRGGLALLLVVALCAGVGLALLPASSPAPAPARATPKVEPLDPALAEAGLRALDREASLEARTVALKQLSQARTPTPILAVLRGVAGDDPSRAQVRASALSALARFPDDARVQRELIAVLDGSVQSERLLVLAIVEGLGPRASWASPALDRLRREQDPALRTRAHQVLSRVRPSQPQ